MQRYLVIVIGLIAAGLWTGCNRKDASKSTKVSVPAVAAQPIPTTVAVKAKNPSLAVQEKAAAEKKEPPKAKPVAAVNDKKKEEKKAVVNKPERFAILTPGGPIVVDLLLTIDGRPSADVFEGVVQQVLTAADTDKDGRSSWKELAANSGYLAAQRGGASYEGPAQLKMWTEQFDHNHDGQIQRDEAAAWLGRDGGVTARSFDVRGTRAYLSVPSASSRIWKLLDTDGDNRLSKAEIARGAATLLALDENDDGTLAPQELATLREQLRADGGQSSAGDGEANSYAVIFLGPKYEVDRLEYVLGDLYARGQILRPESFAACGDAYKKLDTDGDGQLAQDELAAMQMMPAQLKLAIEFGGAGKAQHASLKVIDHISEIALEQVAADRVVLLLGTTRVVVSALDRSSGQAASATAAGGQVRMMVHDQCDALGELLDVNGDGILGEHEIASFAGPLSKYDTNHDGQISNDELPCTMIAAVVRGERSGEQSLYRPAFPPALGIASDAPAWFVHADYNKDGEVSHREFLGTAEQFSLLDKNHDGFIGAEEAKQSGSAPAKQVD